MPEPHSVAHHLVWEDEKRIPSEVVEDSQVLGVFTAITQRMDPDQFELTDVLVVKSGAAFSQERKLGSPRAVGMD